MYKLHMVYRYDSKMDLFCEGSGSVPNDKGLKSLRFHLTCSWTIIVRKYVSD